MIPGSCYDIAHGCTFSDYCRYGDDTFTVFAFNGRRRHSFYYFTQVADTDSLTGIVINQDILDVFNRLTEFWCVAYFYIILVTVFAIFGSGRAVDTVTQSHSSRCDIQSVDRQLFPVEINLIFGYVVLTADVDL